MVGLLVALALMRIRERLVADSHGLTIIGLARKRTVEWADIDSMSTPHRGRLSSRRASLEIELRIDVRTDIAAKYDDFLGGPAASGSMPTGGAVKPETELLAFGAFELGTDPAAVGRALSRLRAGSESP